MANHSLNNLPIEYYDDHEEAEKVKNFFSYRLGNLVLEMARKYNVFCIFILPYEIVKLYRDKKRRK